MMQQKNAEQRLTELRDKYAEDTINREEVKDKR